MATFLNSKTFHQVDPCTPDTTFDRSLGCTANLRSFGVGKTLSTD